MARFLSVKNYERYQHYKHRNPPWIKLYYDLLDDDEFIALSVDSRHHYMTLLLIAGRKNNHIPYDPIYLRKVMRLDAVPDLNELITKKFLLASGKQRASTPQAFQNENRAQSISSSEYSSSETEYLGPAASAAPAPQVEKPKRGTIYPEGFEPDERAQMLAVSTGLNPHKELAAFRDHHTAKGTVFKDWQAAFRTWLRNALKYNQRGARA